MDNLTEKIKARHNRLASFYDPLMGAMDMMIRKSDQEKLFSLARGKVLEVGVGTGRNFPFYPVGIEGVTAIDYSPRMLEKARSKLHQSRVSVTLLEMDAQNMAFADQSFDTVVTACVFCSVPDPIKGLHEIRRVLKPDGRLVMLEHVRSENEALGKVMDFVNPVFLNIFGSNINRRTVENVQAAGFAIEKVEKFNDIMRFIIARP
ncbi:MAG: methyltransferase domain-containing protein [Clostridia bacterium]|nr:methyltransferase domain-containing protein [Clostridia bacterium]